MPSSPSPACPLAPPLPARSAEDLAYDSYDFGDGVEVLTASGWNRGGSFTVTRSVFVRFDEDLPDAASTRITFTVRLKGSAVLEAYAMTPKGALLGHLPGTERQR